MLTPLTARLLTLCCFALLSLNMACSDDAAKKHPGDTTDLAPTDVDPDHDLDPTDTPTDPTDLPPGDADALPDAPEPELPDLEDAPTEVDPNDVAELPPGCPSPTRPCGESCCTPAEVCGFNLMCCARESLCGNHCCTADQVCDGAVCRRDCGERVRCQGEAGEVCCGEGEICTSGQCFLPEKTCIDFIDCPQDSYCEPLLGYCLPQPSGEVCAAEPSGGEVRPTLLWAWNGQGAVMPTYNQVMMTPVVARIDDDHIPDVAFNSFAGSNYSNDGILRVISGADASSVFDVTDPAHRTLPGSQIAIGDIDNDGRVELVTCAAVAPARMGDLIAFNHDGTLKWRTNDARVQCGQAAPSIADLDGDGQPEVFLRYTVVNGATGEVIWHHDCQRTGGWATDSHSPCDYTTAADLDGDGKLEIVGGNVAYRYDGSVFYDRTADLDDGYPAIGDLDLDGVPEIVVVQSAFSPTPYQGNHWLRALRANGQDYWGPVDINQANTPAADLASGAVGGGGPATIANFDDDPYPEIALAGAYAYVVFEHDGSLKWFAPTSDRSSRKTGSSVFDFDGDGIAEAVYNDEYWLRVYDGVDGSVRFCQCNPSGTLWEYPVIVDVDADGAAEIVVAANTLIGQNCPTTQTPEQGRDACVAALIEAGETTGFAGVRAFASPNRDWVGTRQIWNQHAYHITNIAEDGSVPRVQAPNWGHYALNNFRQNVQPGATNLPDLQLTDAAVDVRACPESMSVYFRVHNGGWSAAPAGIVVEVLAMRDGNWDWLGQVTTTTRLLAGESELLRYDYPLGPGESLEELQFRLRVNALGQAVAECHTDNNQAEVAARCHFN